MGERCSFPIFLSVRDALVFCESFPHVRHSRTDSRVILVRVLRCFTKRFGEIVAVNGITLEIAPGEFFGLLGPNGAGKTTTLLMLTTLLRPTSGTARVNGFDLVHQAGQVRRSIGVVFQDPLTYSVDGLRHVILGAGHSSLGFDLAVMVGFTAAVIVIGSVAFRRMKV
jgi:ABC-type branched-subunit amino acid transport system ATPase component